MNKVQRILILARRMKFAEKCKRHAASDDESRLFGDIIDQFKADVNDLLLTLTPREVNDLTRANSLWIRDNDSMLGRFVQQAISGGNGQCR